MFAKCTHPTQMAWLAGLLLLAACGTPTGPEVETVDEPDPVEEREPPVPDSPLLPVPSDPLEDAPSTSDTLTMIEPLTTHYRPLLDRMRGSWSLAARECYPSTGCQPYSSRVLGPTWSHLLPDIQLDLQNVPMRLDPPAGRVLFLEDGTALDPVEAAYSSSNNPGGSFRYDRQHQFRGAPLEQTVYLRRDRYWQLLPLSTGAGDYLLVIGNADGTFATTYTQGTTRAETETFGESVTTSVGLSYSALSAGVAQTINQSYSTSISITESTTETFTRTVRGSAGTTTRFMMWALVERYTFTDAEGEPLTHPDYVIVQDELFRRSIATALQATEFTDS